MHMRVNRVSGWLLTLVTAVTPAAAGAQGFGLNEIGTCALARGFAATGAPCNDASVIFWNPAAGTTLQGVTVLAGAAAVSLGGSFTADVTGRRDEASVPIEIPPHVFVNWRATPRFAAGIGAYVPYGLTSEWRRDFPGRFLAQRASLATVYVQPNVSFDVVPGRFSIGGGPVIGHSSVELKQALDISEQAVPGAPVPITFAQLGVVAGTQFATASLRGDATAIGAHIGVMARILPTLTVGARYLTPLTFKYDDARATFEQVSTGFRIPAPTATNPNNFVPLDAALLPQFRTGGALSRQGVKTEIEHPGQIQFGAGFTGIPNTTLSLDGAFVQWSAFDELPVDFQGGAPDRTLIEDYENTFGVRAGIEYLFQFGFAGRAGFSYAQSPAPDETVTPLLPDQDRYNFAVGFGIPLGTRYALDLGYLRVETEGRRGRIVERASQSQTAEQLNSGAYTLDANIFSLSFKALF
jgi:long-chain fatty acid transport protein